MKILVKRIINKILLIFFIPVFIFLIVYVFCGVNGIFNSFQITDKDFIFINGFEKEYDLNRKVKDFGIAINMKDVAIIKVFDSNLIIRAELYDKNNNCIETYVLDEFNEILKYSSSTITIKNRNGIGLNKKTFVKTIKLKVEQQDEKIQSGRDILYISNMIIP